MFGFQLSVARQERFGLTRAVQDGGQVLAGDAQKVGGGTKAGDSRVAVCALPVVVVC